MHQQVTPGVTPDGDGTAEPSYYDEDLERALADSSEDDAASTSHEYTSVGAPAPPLPAAVPARVSSVKRPRAPDDEDLSGLFI